MVEVEYRGDPISAPAVLAALFNEFSAVTDYRTLRDSLPKRLAGLFKCRCVLMYQRNGETLQFASGSFDDKPGWSAALLAVAHINPIGLNSELPEASAWRERRAVAIPQPHPTLVALPLIYRHRGIGVLAAIREGSQALVQEGKTPGYWLADEILVLEAVGGVVALLLENTRLLEQNRERIHELSLLNSISSQMNCSMYEIERMRSVVVQRAREISGADLCVLLEPSVRLAANTWITPVLYELLFQHFRGQCSSVSLVIERPGDASNPDAPLYLAQLPVHVKTLFAFPLRAIGKRGGSLLRGSLGMIYEHTQEPKVLGIVVGAYYRTWKFRREETILLQVLASQASAVWQNLHLMGEVVEARNEARKLLRQVLDDQRMKELILESMPSGLITTDRRNCITIFNRAAQAILGYHPYEVQGQPLHRFLNLRTSLTQGQIPSSPVELRDQQNDVIYSVMQTGEARSGTAITLDRHGRELVLDIDVLPLYDDLGEQIGTLVTFTDVTSVRQLEEEKRRLDRLASLGEMAANVAHEVRNPLASIKTSIQMLMDDLADHEELSSDGGNVTQTDWMCESVSVVLKEVERLDAIVRDLLLFARPRQLHRVKCNLAELSDRVLHLIQSQCVEANVIVRRVYGELPTLWIDIAQMEQILLNLYMNAIQAMPDGGILTVSCQALSPEQAIYAGTEAEADPVQLSAPRVYVTHTYRRYQHDLAAHPWMEVVVSDTGVGIAPDKLECIFQPFFTTKAHGIGLGLAITRRLVEDHGGYIQVEGYSGYGATIIVRLPLTIDES